MAVISLAFGRYVLEPIFMPCGVPEFAIKLATAIGLSKSEPPHYLFVSKKAVVQGAVLEHLEHLIKQEVRDKFFPERCL